MKIRLQSTIELGDNKIRMVLGVGTHEAFNVTDNGGEAFRVTDGGGEDFNVVKE